MINRSVDILQTTAIFQQLLCAFTRPLLWCKPVISLYSTGTHEELMSLHISAKTLSTMAAACARVTPSKSLHSALTSTLITQSGGDISLTATDAINSLTMKATSSSYTIDTDFSVCVDSKKFSEALKAMPQSNDISLHTEESESAASLVISHGKSKIKLPCFSADEFPEPMPMDTSFETVKFSDLKPLFQGVLYAASDDSARANLCSVYLHTKDGHLLSAATDGHRLARASRAKTEGEAVTALSSLFTRDSVLEVMKGDYNYAQVGAQYARFISEGDIKASYMCRLLNEKFPPYEAVIPKSNTYALTAPVADLKSALTRMMVIADDKMHPVSLVIETDSLGLTSLHLESKNDHGVTKEQIQVISTEGEANGSIGFSVKYLQDAISRVTTENLVLRLNPALKSAAIIHDDGPQDKTAVLSIVMPRRA